MQVTSESARPAAGESLPEETSVFDGRTVRLRGARGETLGLHVRLAGDDPGPAELDLPRGVAQVAAFAVRSLEVERASTAMYGETRGRGVYPDVLVPTDGSVRGAESAYFDVAVTKDADPGRYEGTLAIGSRRFPVVLDVSSARIDLAKEPLVWVFYAPREIARQHGLPDGDGPELVAKEAEYDALFRAHGAYLASDVRPSRFEARRRFVHDVKYWPVAVDTSSDDAIRADVRTWLATFAGTGVTPFAIPVDEPRTEEAQRRALHIAEVMGEAGGRRPAFLRSVTDAALPIYGDAMDAFFSPKNVPAVREESASRGLRFFTYNGKPPQAGSMVLDAEGPALRTWGWIAARYDLDLWYAWEGLYFSDRYNGGGPTDVTREAVTFDERRKGGLDFGNGDGLLAYPGALPSLRLKVLRRGLSDRLLLKQLEACGAADTARELARRTVPRALGEAADATSWPEDEAAWDRARFEVLDAIEARCQ